MSHYSWFSRYCGESFALFCPGLWGKHSGHTYGFLNIKYVRSDWLKLVGWSTRNSLFVYVLYTTLVPDWRGSSTHDNNDNTVILRCCDFVLRVLALTTSHHKSSVKQSLGTAPFYILSSCLLFDCTLYVVGLWSSRSTQHSVMFIVVYSYLWGASWESLRSVWSSLRLDLLSRKFSCLWLHCCWNHNRCFVVFNINKPSGPNLLIIIDCVALSWKPPVRTNLKHNEAQSARAYVRSLVGGVLRGKIKRDAEYYQPLNPASMRLLPDHFRKQLQTWTFLYLPFAGAAATLRQASDTVSIAEILWPTIKVLGKQPCVVALSSPCIRCE